MAVTLNSTRTVDEAKTHAINTTCQHAKSWQVHMIMNTVHRMKR